MISKTRRVPKTEVTLQSFLYFASKKGFGLVRTQTYSDPITKPVNPSQPPDQVKL